MFKRCDHCGELFFAEDVRRVENGRLCAICHERGVKLPHKQTATGRRQGQLSDNLWRGIYER